MAITLEWQFGGWLRGLPPATAWSVVAAAAIVGITLVVWLYRHTLKQLSPAARNTLIIFRVMILLVLLVCLANPSHVEKQKPAAPKKTLAVIVDRSASMSIPDYRRVTRLAGAARVWKEHESEATATFSDIKYYRFATELSPATSFDDAVESAKPGPETHLYTALRQMLDANPGAIVCLTDGLDTTGSSREDLANEALRRNVPLYFVAGMNRLQPSRAGDSLNIREIKTPATIMRQAQFLASAVFDEVSPRDSELPVELWSGEKKLASTSLPVRAGQTTLPWSVTVTAPESGTMPLEFRAGKDSQQIAGCTIEIAEHKTVDVLYYQGALQWGYRFLRSALASDPGFQLTGILNPAINVQISMDAAGLPTLPDLPDGVNDLKRFQIIVLAHVFANQLTERQQTALVEYAKGGGSVIFISPDTQATADFAGTALEQMLPVIFAPPSAEENNEISQENFRQQFAAVPQVETGTESEDSAERSQALPPLKPFTTQSGASHSAVSRLFEKSGDDRPMYVRNARVRGVKPGAEILAVSDPANGEPQVLLARQQFGHGFAVAMMTDLLWRWKMSLPGDSRALEKFWQQLLISLAPAQAGSLSVMKLTESPTTNQPVLLQIVGNAAEAVPQVTAISPSGEQYALSLQPSTNGDSAWTASFTPAKSGDWQVKANDAGNKSARLVFPVSASARSAEMMNLPTDVDGMRQLAEATGGAMIEDAPVFKAHEDSVIAANVQHVQPLWNSSWLLGGLLGLYGTELVIRRRFKLL